MTILLKIWLALFFSVLATVAYAENSWTWTPLGGDTGPAHSAGRKLASSPAGDFELVDISSTISTDWKFHGAATASNGKIIFALYHADGVGVFDPTDNSFALVDISSTISTDEKFSGAATASNGKIIFAPSNADGVGFIQAVLTCDASIAPTNGGVGNCTSTLASGLTCQPTCESGYTVSGTSSCSSFGTLTAATCSSGSCDASSAPTNGGAGDCTGSLASGSSCQPTCNSGYTISGTSSCSLGALTAATCTAVVTSGTLSPTPSLLIVLLTTFVCALFL